jgi:hypothetical protein
MQGLTAKEEKVVQFIFQGMSQTDAYMDVYKCKSNAVAEAAASRMLSKVIVKARLNELQGKVEAKTVLSVTERKEKLTEIIEKANLSPVSTRDGIQAVDLLNKMDKVYSDAPTIINNTQTVFIIGKGYDRTPNKTIDSSTLQNVDKIDTSGQNNGQ